ncbi:MAG: tRNA pseudouridine(38-40) synthase TruA [Eubacterium sp.]|nr:tRNA pseudouridine(38-40) synthase TruA [Eubacterium sp.]
MRRIKLTVAYDGTSYCGWQVQPNGITIEQVLNETLSSFFKQDIRVVGASRTDAGVHALGAVCTFDFDHTMPADKVAFAINSYLPDDIVVQCSEEVGPSFHPRYDAKEKTYIYKILNRKMPLPLERFDTHFYYYPLDEKKMNDAASHLVGEHDFTSFASPHYTAKTTIRNIYECSVSRSDEDIITIKIRGNGFLYNMVRIIAGTLMEVGGGKISPEDIPLILEKKDRDAAGPTAPAKGLTLVEVRY